MASLSVPPRLSLRFAVYAGVAVLLAGAASVFAGKLYATERAKQDVSADARFLADRLGRDDLARAALHGPADGDERAQLDELFHREALGPSTSRVSVVDREGRITYSTDHSLIGTTVRDLDLLGEALAGRPAHGVAETGAGRVVESYVSLHWLLADPSWPAGALAVERDYALVAAAIREDVRIQSVGILLALLLLYVSLFPILGRVTRTLAERNRELVASEAQYRALTEQASDAIFVTDSAGVVLETNEQACALLGRTGEQIRGRSFGDFIDPDELARTPLRLEELRSGETILHDRALVRPDGSPVLGELHSRMLEDGRILVSVRDVTDRRQAEEAVRRAERAEASERLALGIAHDFDRLLVGAGASIRALTADIGEGDPLRRHADDLADAAGQAAALIEQMEAFGRKREPGRPRVLELGEFVERLEPELRRAVARRVEVVLDLAETPGRVQVDPVRLEQLVLGLAINAREGMGEGTVTVRVENVDFGRRSAPRGGNSQVDPGRYVMLSIADTGRPADTGDERLGLGLAALVGLVKQSGGTMGVEAEPGVGTTVRVYLPRVDAPVEQPVRPEPSTPLGGSETILLAEDEEVVHAIVREILETEGYTVLGARNGLEALEVCERHADSIDLLVSDVVMPELGGPQLAEEVLRRWPEIPVVLMSGYAEDGALGGDGTGYPFLQKPFTHASLLAMVRDVLDGHVAAPVPEPVA